MKRELLIKATIDWDEYDDVSDKMIFEDLVEMINSIDGVKLYFIREEQ